MSSSWLGMSSSWLGMSSSWLGMSSSWLGMARDVFFGAAFRCFPLPTFSLSGGRNEERENGSSDT